MRIAGDVEAEESDAIVCNGKKYLSDICYCYHQHSWECRFVARPQGRGTDYWT